MEYKSKVVLLIIVVFFLLAQICFIVASNIRKANMQPTLSIGGKVTIPVEIADTDEKRTLGYSNHKPISFSEGILFSFPLEGNYLFWMKDMLFDLDFIYFKNNRIVGTKEGVLAPIHNNGEIVYVNAPANFEKLLEVKSGFVRKFKISIGDEIIVR